VGYHGSFPEPSLAVIKLEGRRGGIPHLAKNERDMGHPAIVVGTERGLSSRILSTPFVHLGRVLLPSTEAAKKKRYLDRREAGDKEGVVLEVQGAPNPHGEPLPLAWLTLI